MRAAPSSSSAGSRVLPGAGEPRRNLHLHRRQAAGTGPGFLAAAQSPPRHTRRERVPLPRARAPGWPHSGGTQGTAITATVCQGGTLSLAEGPCVRPHRVSSECQGAHPAPLARSSVTQGNIADPAAACTHPGWAGAGGGTSDHGNSGKEEEEDDTGTSGSGPAHACCCRW